MAYTPGTLTPMEGTGNDLADVVAGLVHLLVLQQAQIFQLRKVARANTTEEERAISAEAWTDAVHFVLDALPSRLSNAMPSRHELITAFTKPDEAP